jgi:hypothetical protein
MQLRSRALVGPARWLENVVNCNPCGETRKIGSVQNISHFWFGLSGARHWLKR